MSHGRIFMLNKRKESKMTIKDIGPQPQSFDLERATRENKNYRTVAWSGRYLQVTLMSIPMGSDIGLEMHPDTDQFLRLDAGRGRAQIGPSKD
jgi:mannose-6-phosphate isomerase-like protein (cupin superfamily)